MSLTRRDLLVGSTALAAGALVSLPFFLPKYHVDRRPKRSRVAILNAEQYSQKLDEALAAGLRLFPIDVRGKRVVLKPNLVDYAPGEAINTHPLLVLAAAESFRRLGAKSVLVAEGPGHQRDTQLVLLQSGYQASLQDERKHTSTNCCHSRLLRAKRDTSRAATAPTLPKQTSATMRSKPARVTVPAADRPRSSSTTSTSRQPSCCKRSCMAYCNL